MPGDKTQRLCWKVEKATIVSLESKLVHKMKECLRKTTEDKVRFCRYYACSFYLKLAQARSRCTTLPNETDTVKLVDTVHKTDAMPDLDLDLDVV